MAGAVINAAARLGDNVIVNTGAIVEHDCVIGDGSVIGMKSVLLVGCKVGNEALIAAGSVVRENDEVPDRVVAAGVPARVNKELGGNALEFLRRGHKDYLYLLRHYRGDEGLPELDYVPEHLE